MKSGPRRRQRRINARARPPDRAQPRRRRAPGNGRPETKGPEVLDLLYAGVVIVVFAILLLAVRGLDRL